MNKLEALKALAEGRKVRQGYWEKYEYITVNSNGCLIYSCQEYADWNPLSCIDWEIYIESRKKEKLYYHTYIDREGAYTLTKYMYTKEGVNTNLGKKLVYKSRGIIEDSGKEVEID